MGLGKRLSAIFGGGQDDPQQELEASYDRQVELLQSTRRAAADVTTSRKRLELQLRRLEARADELHAQAVVLVGQGQDEPARALLVQHAGLLAQVEALGPQERELREDEQQLAAAVERLEAQVEAFRNEKDALSAGLTAAQARTRSSTALAGADAELGGAGFALQQARDRTEAARAQADALEELTAIGTTSAGDAALQRLAELSGGGVDAELARLKDATPLPGPLPPQQSS